ncbi:class I SAM-dependent methyltransferase [Methylomonas sp. LW13]|uniref:class I SAM-dependent methyltransferase n=1 Tax=unclassified Methylomonas TaxID=2608980 RepID=UPI00068BA168|nr:MULTISPECIES: class I SAM-dependent methyltransferase [unclassified Methylomonas]NOV31990.1 class I SAM-dependent methyltransferase [Methylomonas sp. ZR1]PKD40218.1 class I SAM-dependent methyltransferase [Methylomonas sp. Kb3]QBC29633.1 class I SAM-dependent methyltransferase [Methylomonas sp. LW13]
MGTDKDWEQWGAADPYFGVLSSDEFRKDRLDARAKDEFFASGRRHIERVFQLISENFGHAFFPNTALDFGCGVGRLVLTLAERTERTVGIDISPSMIAEALDNTKYAGITNVSFVLSDDALTNVVGEFSFVHSCIVLQHIPWARGRLILQQLADRVEPGGYLAVHFLTSSSAPKLIRAAVRLRYVFPPLNWLRNLTKRRPLFEPAMQLHIYNTGKIILDLKERNFETPVCCNEPDMDGFTSILLLARRLPKP